MFSMDSCHRFDSDSIKKTAKYQQQNQQAVTKNAKNYLREHLIKSYSTSQSFYYLKTITNIIQKKEKDYSVIKIQDHKFNDQKEHFQRYYFRNQSIQELPQLFEYYKYYTQQALCFLNRQFSFLAVHHQRKKAALYFLLKKKLNISDSQPSLSSVTKMKEQKLEIGNVLSGLSMTIIKNDESYCVHETLKKLTRCFGPSTRKSIHEIDSEFKFMAHNNKQKNLKVQTLLQKKNRVLESTNTSLRNQSQQRTQKGVSHKRYISCQLTAIQNKNDSTINQNIPKKSKNIKRRKSADCLEYTSNLKGIKPQQTSIIQNHTKMLRKNQDKTVKKQNPGQKVASNKIPLIKKNKQSTTNIKTSTTYITQATVQKQKQRQVKNTIEHLRSQIRKQKQNINHNSAKKINQSKKHKKAFN